MNRYNHLAKFALTGAIAQLSSVLILAAPGVANAAAVVYPLTCALRPNGTVMDVGIWPSDRELPAGTQISVMMDAPGKPPLWKTDYTLQAPWPRDERRYLDSAYPPEIVCHATATVDDRGLPVSRLDKTSRTLVGSPQIVKPAALTPKIVPKPRPGRGQPPRQQ